MASDLIYESILDYVAQQGGLEDAYGVMDAVARSAGAGSQYSRYQDLFYGLNALPNLAPLPVHREMQGLVLFTRPELNLSYDNIAPIRTFSQLLTQDPITYPYAVRMMLDPITYRKTTRSPLVDKMMPYMALLSNCVVSMNTPPDIGINVYSSPEGIAKEVWIMNDSIAEYNGRYDLTVQLHNPPGNAPLLTMHSWLTYMGALRVGPCIPHVHSRQQNKMDYFTRIERYKFDITGRKVEQWFHTGAAVPTNLSIGQGFGFTREEALEMENKQISVQFACVGAVYNDPIQLLEFNIRMIRYNPSLADGVRSQRYVKADPAAKKYVNFNSYPLINLSTYEMEWWVDRQEYDRLIRTL